MQDNVFQARNNILTERNTKPGQNIATMRWTFPVDHEQKRFITFILEGNNYGQTYVIR